VPLSEDEQRILQEMEQTLREHDRSFAARVDQTSHRLDAAKGSRWTLLGAVAGLVLLLCTFRSSTIVAAVGFLLMLGSTILFVQHVRQAAAPRPPQRGRRHLGDDWSEVRRRMRSRFGNHD
jgi:Protein of unknown function (DUF3040)